MDQAITIQSVINNIKTLIAQKRCESVASNIDLTRYHNLLDEFEIQVVDLFEQLNQVTQNIKAE